MRRFTAVILLLPDLPRGRVPIARIVGSGSVVLIEHLGGLHHRLLSLEDDPVPDVLMYYVGLR